MQKVVDVDQKMPTNMISKVLRTEEANTLEGQEIIPAPVIRRWGTPNL